jgi:hypothetical protein
VEEGWQGGWLRLLSEKESLKREQQAAVALLKQQSFRELLSLKPSSRLVGALQP